MLYAANVADTDLASGNAYVKKLIEKANEEESQVCVVSARIESELNELEEKDRDEFMFSFSDGKTKLLGCEALVGGIFNLLGLQTYFTAGPKEVRAWTIKKESTALESAAVIHSDLAKGFIQAEVINYNEARDDCGDDAKTINGRMRKEGKDYIVKDGDLIIFKSGLANSKK